MSFIDTKAKKPNRYINKTLPNHPLQPSGVKKTQAASLFNGRIELRVTLAHEYMQKDVVFLDIFGCAG